MWLAPVSCWDANLPALVQIWTHLMKGSLYAVFSPFSQNNAISEIDQDTSGDISAFFEA